MRRALVSSLVLSNILLIILVVSLLTGFSPFTGAGHRKSEDVEKLRVSLISLDSSLATGLSVHDLRQRAGEILTNYRLAANTTSSAGWAKPTMAAIQAAGAVAEVWASSIGDGMCRRDSDGKLYYAPSCESWVNEKLKDAGVEETVSVDAITSHDFLVSQLLTILSAHLDTAVKAF
jgi:hypothetical protein